MAPSYAPGEPREGSKPQPLGNFGLLFISTTITLCLLYLLWRRASSLRAVVSHQLKTWTRQEGTIRLSEDDGPSATEFLADADDEDIGRIDDDEPLAQGAERLRAAGKSSMAVSPPPPHGATE
ncbi:hypothetical protein BV22DRAFT_1127266 [Leucogyrophana mollusca]|uniref:Uncharacterized protein n=1 Tax=Leucogyrophana mollusca TaxID=85980 RepID=A0ACB8BPY1_9AGAM|nr:hypothetical protein BV22DRAFT_1127266 [Leucogyrophana mollusca]